MKIKIFRLENGVDMPHPTYQTNGASGMDLYAAVENKTIILPNCVLLIPTGFSVEIPIGYEAQVRPRSGLASKFGIVIPNSPGTIDSDYRGEIKVILMNLGKENFTINRGDRIAQLVIAKYEKISWEEVDILSVTERGDGGFGHTGINSK